MATDCLSPEDPTGLYYDGTISTTVDGRDCINWEDPSLVHMCDNGSIWNCIDDIYPLYSFIDDRRNHNYCRNPIGPRHDVESAPWCYLPNLYDSKNDLFPGQGFRWELCSIPQCEASLIGSDCDQNTEFLCLKSDSCIPMRWKCDLFPDCEHGEDEENCGEIETTSTTPAILSTTIAPFVPRCDNLTEFTCTGTNGNNRLRYCIPNVWKCDGDVDCHDLDSGDHGSDEENCCGPDQLVCPHSELKCISAEKKCDIVIDCIFNAIDEMNCDSVNCARVNRTRCLDKKGCYSHQQRCDGVWDCTDASDELHCPHDDSKKDCRNFHCLDDSGCIPFDRICDGHRDCANAADENAENCKALETNLCGPDTCLHGICHNTPYGPYCVCYPGFKKLHGMTDCQNINECEHQAFVCSQICTDLVPISTDKRGFKCSCHPQFKQNGTSCSATGPPLKYLMAEHISPKRQVRDGNVRLVEHDGFTGAKIKEVFSMPTGSEKQIITFAIYDIKRKVYIWIQDSALIYVMHEHDRKIKHIPISFMKRDSIIGKEVYDYVTGNLYLAIISIKKLSLKTNFIVVNVPTGHQVELVSIKFMTLGMTADLNRGMLYISCIGNASNLIAWDVLGFNMDFKNVNHPQVLLHGEDYFHPTSLAFDMYANRLYLFQLEDRRITAIDLSKKGPYKPSLIYHSDELLPPNLNSLQVFQESLFWIVKYNPWFDNDHLFHKIHAVSKQGERHYQIKHDFQHAFVGGHLTSMTLIQELLQPYEEQSQVKCSKCKFMCLRSINMDVACVDCGKVNCHEFTPGTTKNPIPTTPSTSIENHVTSTQKILKSIMAEDKEQDFTVLLVVLFIIFIFILFAIFVIFYIFKKKNDGLTERLIQNIEGINMATGESPKPASNIAFGKSTSSPVRYVNIPSPLKIQSPMKKTTSPTLPRINEIIAQQF